MNVALTFCRMGANGHSELTVWLDDVAIHKAHVEIGQAGARNRFYSDVIEAHPEIDCKQLVREIARIAAEVKDGKIHLRRITAAQLDGGDYTLEYLVEGVLVKGQPCIIAGGRKSLKTSIAIGLGISLVTGTPFLGKMKVERPCRVGILSGESGLSTLQETARRVCLAAGFRLSEIVEGLVFSPDIPIFESLPHLDALREFIARDELEVLMIDPAYMAMSGAEAGNLFVQGQKLRMVNQVCDELGTTFALIHHTKRTGKASPFAPVELDEIAWSGFAEWARQWVLLGRREPYEVGSGFHKLWLTTGGSAGHNHLWAVDVDEGPFTPGVLRKWDVTVNTPDDARVSADAGREAVKDKQREARVEDAKRRIIEALVKFPDGESPRGIRIAAGLGPDRFNPALAGLIRDGTAVACDIPKSNRKQPYEGYKLGEDTPR